MEHVCAGKIGEDLLARVCRAVCDVQRGQRDLRAELFPDPTNDDAELANRQCRQLGIHGRRARTMASASDAVAVLRAHGDHVRPHQSVLNASAVRGPIGVATARQRLEAWLIGRQRFDCYIGARKLPGCTHTTSRPVIEARARSGAIRSTTAR